MKLFFTILQFLIHLQYLVENHSPTCRGKLIKVNKTTCTFEVVLSAYRCGDESRVGERYKVPISWAWNAFFF